MAKCNIRVPEYFIRLGRSTMTQADIDAGRLILEIGAAPLKPA